MHLEFKAQGIEDLKFLAVNEPIKAKKVLSLINQIIDSPIDGQSLKNELVGWSSVSIDANHRLVFRREPDRIVVAQTRFHSDRI